MNTYFDVVNVREDDRERFLVCSDSAEAAVSILKADGKEGEFECREAPKDFVARFGPLMPGAWTNIPDL